MEITIGSKYRIQRLNLNGYDPFNVNGPEGTIVQVYKPGISTQTVQVINLDGDRRGGQWYCHKGRLAPVTPEDPYAETDF